MVNQTIGSDVPAVRMRGIGKAFGGVVALSDVDFSVQVGEIHALMGENGAGKSTLMKILQGAYSADRGEIAVNGAPIQVGGGGPLAARAAGIGMVFQEFSLVPTLTVAQNVFLTIEPRRRDGLIDDQAMRARTAEIFESIEVDIDPGADLRDLGTAYWQLTEIAKALAHTAKILIMDEPTASLARHEAEALFALVGRLKSRGISIIYTSHRIEEVFRISDRITVLRNGEVVRTFQTRATTSAEVIQAMLGRHIEGALEWRDREVGPTDVPVLEVENLCAGTRVRGVSLTLHEGEVLGLVGLMGSGRTELTRALFGIDKHEDGKVTIGGRRIVLRNPDKAIRMGIALIPEDRRAQGLVLTHSVADNLTLPVLDDMRSRVLLDRGKVRTFVRRMVDRFSIKVSHPGTPVQTLSGGNQQKVVIAKWLATEPRILLLDEATAGIDIGTKTEILEMIRSAAEQRKGVLFISSELAEILAVCDRVLIMRNGAVVKSIPRSKIDSEHSLQLMIQEA
jgi:ribose transport system ATP-binding protein